MSSNSASAVLAGAPGDCCFKGVKHSGEPAGKAVDIAGVSTYIAEPKSGQTKGIILFFADVYGPFYLNNQLLQDYFAESGFLVLGIDYFFGDAIYKHTEAGFDRSAWIQNARTRAAEETPKWVQAVRQQYGTDKKYTAVGYCFGGPHALGIAGTDQVVAAAFAHPAFLDEDDFRKLTKPLLILAAETDHTFPPESRRRAVDILQEVNATYHVRLFSGVSHGFASRGDPNVENSRWAKEEAAASVVGFFSRFIAA
ncbi:alpha/beta-hydrolase [Macrolepiota fuliginosa MF-IS2]|uniref:Alpha/beta-hydrolase n=1 Tax=Macrolepiota fuliginosa MF-IS2 TaxID=1400762 RepID=A0A9P6BYQ1_9AGAR|nr:alpha/beta-hydrolase [Macrolepiota fuliginosa MF-IS2]